mmetsp:Transcript_22254/g.75559  ORF Transcript_22254/g.75559 Transcript_22254/m.75559 type:complete len:250 (-) Transcript_22254:412-1161(-)
MVLMSSGSSTRCRTVKSRCTSWKKVSRSPGLLSPSIDLRYAEIPLLSSTLLPASTSYITSGFMPYSPISVTSMLAHVAVLKSFGLSSERPPCAVPAHRHWSSKKSVRLYATLAPLDSTSSVASSAGKCLLDTTAPRGGMEPSSSMSASGMSSSTRGPMSPLASASRTACVSARSSSSDTTLRLLLALITQLLSSVNSSATRPTSSSVTVFSSASCSLISSSESTTSSSRRKCRTYSSRRLSLYTWSLSM